MAELFTIPTILCAFSAVVDSASSVVMSGVDALSPDHVIYDLFGFGLLLPLLAAASLASSPPGLACAGWHLDVVRTLVQVFFDVDSLLVFEPESLDLGEILFYEVVYLSSFF